MNSSCSIIGLMPCVVTADDSGSSPDTATTGPLIEESIDHIYIDTRSGAKAYVKTKRTMKHHPRRSDSVNTCKQICLNDQCISDDEGNKLELKRGQEYITTIPQGDEVTVLSSYWVKVPAEWFSGATDFTVDQPRAQDIVERIMTEHWDMAACNCWVCQAGDILGLGARDKYLPHKENYEPLPGKSLKEYYK